MLFANTPHPLAQALQQKLAIGPWGVISQNNTWCFQESLNALSTQQLLPIILEHTNLKITHDALCAEARLNADKYDANERARRIVAALMYSEALMYIYTHYVPVSNSALKDIEKSQVFYKKYLREIGVFVPEDTQQNMTEASVLDERVIRQTTTELDFWRQLFVRSRRALMFSIAVVNNYEAYGQWVFLLDSVLKIFAIYHAALLIPRLVTNLVYLFNHPKAQASQDDLTPLQAYLAQLDMQARWWEIAYDFGWVTCGLLGAFILTGALAPAAVYLLVVNPSYNLILNTIRFSIEYSRFNALEKHYEDELLLLENEDQKEALLAFIKSLKARGHAQLMPLVVRIGVSICIVSTALVMLLLVATPWAAFAAAVLAVVGTIAGKLIAQNLPGQNANLDEKQFNILPIEKNDEASTSDNTRTSSHAIDTRLEPLNEDDDPQIGLTLEEMFSEVSSTSDEMDDKATDQLSHSQSSVTVVNPWGEGTSSPVPASLSFLVNPWDAKKSDKSAENQVVRDNTNGSDFELKINTSPVS